MITKTMGLWREQTYGAPVDPSVHRYRRSVWVRGGMGVWEQKTFPNPPYSHTVMKTARRMKKALLLVALLGATHAACSQDVDDAKHLDDFRGSVSVTNKGISTPYQRPG